MCYLRELSTMLSVESFVIVLVVLTLKFLEVYFRRLTLQSILRKL